MEYGKCGYHAIVQSVEFDYCLFSHGFKILNQVWLWGHVLLLNEYCPVMGVVFECALGVSYVELVEGHPQLVQSDWVTVVLEG